MTTAPAINPFAWVAIILLAGCESVREIAMPKDEEPVEMRAIIPDVPTEGRNNLYWKEQFDPNDGHFGYPPSRRMKVTLPESFTEMFGPARDMKLTASSSGISITVGP